MQTTGTGVMSMSIITANLMLTSWSKLVRFPLFTVVVLAVLLRFVCPGLTIIIARFRGKGQPMKVGIHYRLWSALAYDKTTECCSLWVGNCVCVLYTPQLTSFR